MKLWHLGTLAPNYGPLLPLEALDACASDAEDVGYDSPWVTDQPAVPGSPAPTCGRIAEALVTVGYLAARTTRISLGVSALVVSQRQLLLALKQVMTARLLSGGRLQEFRSVGVDGFVVDLLGGEGSLSERLAYFAREVRPYLN